MTQKVPVGTTTATIEGLNAGGYYQFEVRAVNEHGKSDWSSPLGNVPVSAVNLAEVKFTTKTKAVIGKIVVEEKAKAQLKPDSAKISWVPATDVDTYVITYTVPSGLKGVAGTTVQLVIPKGAITAGGSIESPFGPCNLVAEGGRLTLTINGLRASASYKVSIVAKDAGGFTTKAMNTTVKTAAVAPINKLVVNKAKTTANAAEFSILLGGNHHAWSSVFAIGGYIVQVYRPAVKAVGEVGPQLVQTLYSSGTGPIDLVGLRAATKYTVVVTATTATSAGEALMDDGHLLLLDQAGQPAQKLSASKSIAITTKKV
jgi:hypothetical protein